MNPSHGNIRELRVRAVKVPMTEPHRTASGTITESPLVLADVITEDGVVGHSMVFTHTEAALKPTAELITNLEPLIVGEPLAPAEIAQRLARRFRLLGPQGLVGIALAAVDMALWDALARLSLPLADSSLGRGREAHPCVWRRGFRRCFRFRARRGGMGQTRVQGGQGKNRLRNCTRGS
jgi:L-alanine-DL-glutamate epimerase-like enolase superfamily enzyme